jgi:hypothetical protein
MTNLRNNQPFSGARAQASSYDEGLRHYMLGVYNYMTAALALTGIIAYLVASVPALAGIFYHITPDGQYAPNIVTYIAMFAPVLLVFYLGARLMHMSTQQAQGMFFLYAGLMGLSLSHIFLVFTGVSIAKVLLITASAFGGLSLYGYTTKKDLSGFGSFLIMGVWGLFIAGIVNMFLQSPAVHYAMSAIGVLVFAGLTAYDTQQIRRMYYEIGGDSSVAAKVSILGALKLYMDFINLFIFLLQFFGDRRQ